MVTPAKQRCDFCQRVLAEFMFAKRDESGPLAPTYRICACCMREGNTAFAKAVNTFDFDLGPRRPVTRKPVT